MNSHLRPSDLDRTTRAAEGLDRRRWSVGEVEALTEAGIIFEDERFELIGGEFVPMSPKGDHHEVIKASLNLYWARRLPAEISFIPETTFRLSGDTFVEPDFLFFPKAVALRDLSPQNVLLAVEVADSSLAYDRGSKARLYASFGVRELWVIAAVHRETEIFTEPGPQSYHSVRRVGANQLLTPAFAPELAVTLSSLEVA